MTKRGACALFALACGLGSAAAAADDGTPAGRLAVWAIGLPHGGYVVMEHQTPAIHVTAADVAKGVVEVSGGSRFAITTRAPAGYTVNFATRGALCRTVTVDGIGRTTNLGPGGGMAVQREAAAGKRVVAVNYRCFLAPDAAPGSYPWPLEMVIREIAPGDSSQPSAAGRLVTIGGRHL
jgi:hypothetical protein